MCYYYYRQSYYYKLNNNFLKAIKDVLHRIETIFLACIKEKLFFLFLKDR